MKKVSIFLAVSTLVILFFYISYNEITKPHKERVEEQSFSDQEVAEVVIPIGEGQYHAVSLPLPHEINFANEPVPMNIPDVRERLDRELQMNVYLHSNTLFLIKRAHRWSPQMVKIMEEYGVPTDFQYLPIIESYLMNDTSPKDAVGFWQILKDSGKEFGLEVSKDVDERYDPLKSTEAACKYLKKAHAKFGNWTLAAASYNRGMSGVQRALDNQDVNNYYDLYLNEETARYVFRILAIKEIIQKPEKYGFKIDPAHLYK
jgi:membrane-bound lytic murein transglycosylase D